MTDNLKLSMNSRVTKSLYSEQLIKLRGLTIAVVYIFEGEDAKGFEHYDVWRMDVLGDWLRAIEEIGGIPYIMDVRTFGQKALNNTLPCIDFVVNLNAGNVDLSTLSLVPSICAFKSIPCLPCDAFASIIGEHKQVSNIIAANTGLEIPTSRGPVKSAISKPTSLGSSIGIKRTKHINQPCMAEFSQEFIEGIDLTTPVLFHPYQKRLVACSSIAYLPSPFDPEWFLSAEAKNGKSPYRKVNATLSNCAKRDFIGLAQKLGINTYCRVDARVYSTSEDEIMHYLRTEIPADRVRFIEVNPLPTTRSGINFCNAIQAKIGTNEFLEPLEEYKELILNPSIVGFILSNAILGSVNG